MVLDENRSAAFERAEEISPDALCVRGGGEGVIHAQPEKQPIGGGAWPLGRAGSCRSCVPRLLHGKCSTAVPHRLRLWEWRVWAGSPRELWLCCPCRSLIPRLLFLLTYWQLLLGPLLLRCLRCWLRLLLCGLLSLHCPLHWCRLLFPLHR